jgi:hypothetical protein
MWCINASAVLLSLCVHGIDLVEHQGQLDHAAGDARTGITWTTRLHADAAAAHERSVELLPLAVAIKAEEWHAATPSLVPVIDERGLIRAIERHVAVPDPTPEFITQERPGSEGLALRPPLLSGNAVQRVVLEGVRGLRYSADPELGLERHTTYFATGNISRHDRAVLARRLRAPPAKDSVVVWLALSPHTADLVTAQNGLGGELSAMADQRTGLLVGAAIVFVLLTAALAFLYRAHARGAHLERAYATLRAEVDSGND